MSGRKWSGRKAAIALASLAVLAVFVYYVRRDLALENVAKVADLPEVVVESLDFRRTIDGREWHIKVERAERRDNVITGTSMDVSVEGRGRSMRTSASSGVFSELDSDLELKDVYGTMKNEEKTISVAADVARYVTSGDEWFFPHGLTAADGKVFIKGSAGRVKTNGVFVLDKGASVNWK